MSASVFGQNARRIIGEENFCFADGLECLTTEGFRRLAGAIFRGELPGDPQAALEMLSQLDDAEAADWWKG